MLVAPSRHKNSGIRPRHVSARVRGRNALHLRAASIEHLFLLTLTSFHLRGRSNCTLVGHLAHGHCQPQSSNPQDRGADFFAHHHEQQPSIAIRREPFACAHTYTRCRTVIHGVSEPRPEQRALRGKLRRIDSQEASIVDTHKKQIDAAASDEPSHSTRFGEACMTPKHVLTPHDLQALRGHGDVVTNATGHKVRMVVNELGQRLFESSLQSLQGPPEQTPTEVVEESPIRTPESTPSHHAKASNDSPEEVPCQSQSVREFCMSLQL